MQMNELTISAPFTMDCIFNLVIESIFDLVYVYLLKCDTVTLIVIVHSKPQEKLHIIMYLATNNPPPPKKNPILTAIY